MLLIIKRYRSELCDKTKTLQIDSKVLQEAESKTEELGNYTRRWVNKGRASRTTQKDCWIQ